MVKIKKSRKRKTPQKRRQCGTEQLAYETSQELLHQALYELGAHYPPEQLDVEEVMVFDHAALLLRDRMAGQMDSMSLDSARVLLMVMMFQADGRRVDMQYLSDTLEEMDLDPEKPYRPAPWVKIS
ncbi:hypothetical protein [Pantoea stewartii]|uniref:Uncharacterized protein n=1 Tax=Pantoea stewartii TaxID=66269 RepID=A0AB34VDM2_9GAMM|nr:hypothetical protein [Pantoea stewartii]KTS70543.1 hypothetical protein RSA30_21700 [Pantoea stewartii]KTS96474.1 hypothetical protein RSA13_12595 [Pantoea stewartii]KTT06387.1 hypothetical protein RSA36_17700 [Pantoea stewartii]